MDIDCNYLADEVVALGELIQHQLLLIKRIKYRLGSGMNSMADEVALLCELSREIEVLRHLQEEHFSKQSYLRRVERRETRIGITEGACASYERSELEAPEYSA